jgi:hypothetical protein
MVAAQRSFRRKGQNENLFRGRKLDDYCISDSGQYGTFAMGSVVPFYSSSRRLVAGHNAVGQTGCRFGFLSLQRFDCGFLLRPAKRLCFHGTPVDNICGIRADMVAPVGVLLQEKALVFFFRDRYSADNRLLFSG